MAEELCSNQSHEDIERRVSKLEKDVGQILEEMQSQLITTSQVKGNMELILSQQTQMNTDIKELRVDMMNLVTRTLDKTHDEIAAFVELSETHRMEQEKKEQSYRQRQEEKERAYQMDSDARDKSFYRKLIIGCFTIGGTIVLAFYGIKELVRVFG